jgi:hypothetical protein
MMKPVRTAALALILPTLDAAVAWTESSKHVAVVPGIWKLETSSLPRCGPSIVPRDPGRDPRTPGRSADTTNDHVLFNVNRDGSFRQCNEGYTEGAWMMGKWAFVGRDRLRFALNRQYYGPAYDLALEGELQSGENGELVVVGKVFKGRVALPSSDPNYFRDGLSDAQVLGPFHLVQRVAAVGTDDDADSSVAASLDGAILGEDGGFQ